MSSRRRNSYTVNFKVSVAEWVRKNQASLHQAAREFDVDRKRVREWCEKYDDLKVKSTGAGGKRRRLNSGRTPLSTDLDQRLLDFLEEERSEGRPVSNISLKAKAAQIAGGLNIDGFKASAGWLWRWKRRHNIGMRAGTNSAQKVPADYRDRLHDFRKSVITVRKAKNIDSSRIVNMDQTMCRFDMPPSRTNSKKGVKTVRIKTTRAEKKGFTVALAASASGEKFPALIIFKERGGSLGVRVRRSLIIPSNIQVRATTNGWMTGPEYQHWLIHIYGKETQHRLLIVDSYKPHMVEANTKMVKDRCNADVIIIPGGCTSIVQPMDRCINKPFKEHMRASWQDWMRQDRAKTKMGNLKQPTRQDVINWVSKAWASIKEETLTHSFLVCGISNALDGSEDDAACDDIPSVEWDSESESTCQESEGSDDEDVDEMGDPFSEDSSSD